jgi:hypothetical protein
MTDSEMMIAELLARLETTARARAAQQQALSAVISDLHTVIITGDDDLLEACAARLAAIIEADFEEDRRH